MLIQKEQNGSRTTGDIYNKHKYTIKSCETANTVANQYKVKRCKVQQDFT